MNNQPCPYCNQEEDDCICGDLAADYEADKFSQLFESSVNNHHPDCSCARCHYGDDAYVWNFHPSEY